MLKGFLDWTSCEICLDVESTGKISFEYNALLHYLTPFYGKKRKINDFRYIYFYDLGFLSDPCCRVSGGFLWIAAKWHLLCYKAYYIMLWISQRAYVKQPQHVEQLTVGRTVVQFFRPLLTFLILGWMCWLCWQCDLSCLITGGDKVTDMSLNTQWTHTHTRTHTESHKTNGAEGTITSRASQSQAQRK